MRLLGAIQNNRENTGYSDRLADGRAQKMEIEGSVTIFDGLDNR